MKRTAIAIAAVFIWTGFVGAISFMEAWLKFRAPGITLPLGLGIGRLVFAALNKMEWACLLLACYGAWSLRKTTSALNILLLLLTLILVMQTAWMLPALDARATLVIRRLPVPSSNLHFWYIVIEMIKLILLFTSGRLLLKRHGAAC